MSRLLHILTVPMSLAFLRGQASYMRENGFDVHVVTSDDPALWKFARDEQVSAHAVEMRRTISPVRDIIAYLQLLRLIRRLQPDIVHAGTPKAGLLGILAAATCRVPTRIYHLRGLRFESEKGLLRLVLLWMDRLACTFATDILSVSASVRAVAVQSSLAKAEKIHVLGAGSSNGVDGEHRFNPTRLPANTRHRVRDAHNIPRDAFVVGYVGRLCRDKGLCELLDAWENVAQGHASAQLLLVGLAEGFTHRNLRPPRASTLRVHCAGVQSDLARYYAAMDLLVLPTYREGFPNVALEAAAMELPVVATRVTGCVDAVVDGETGTLVEPRSVAGLADAITEYIGGHLQVRGARGAQRARRDFLPIAVWNNLRRFYLTRTEHLSTEQAHQAPRG